MAHAVTVNPRVLEMEYAVRGPIPQRATEMEREGRRTIPCNIGNPQALGQRPITFSRQVLALLEDAGGGRPGMPDEVVETARAMLEASRTGTGAYTESAGFRFVREAVARFIDRRDRVDETGGVPSDPDLILLTDGASGGVNLLLEALITGPRDGVLVPIPQYPLYSATIARCGGTLVPYYPDEDSGWNLRREHLVAPLEAARSRGITVKAVVAINPGNPTGAILDDESIRRIVAVAREWELCIVADEVYQENTYGRPWTSFARILGREDVPLFSLHSVSKGFYGECGHRGGYMEIRNPPGVRGTELSLADVLLKQASVNLCPNTVGQFLVYLMVTGPPEGTPSADLFQAERRRILDDLAAKAAMIKEYFGRMEGVRCFGETGALYLFPRLEKLPPGTGDFEYCMALLEETGLVTVNGAGFGQAPGTHHLRIAFLPPFDLIREVMPRWVEFHARYLRGA